MNKISMYRWIKMLRILQYFACLLIARILLLLPNFRNIWIIAERGTDARDNAFHLFEYIMKLENRPNIYYIIDKGSSDFYKLQKYPNVIQRGSIKHWLYFCLSKVKISTHIMGYAPDIYTFIYLDKFNIVFGKKIFLQHGIINNDLKGLYYPQVKLDLFVCGSYVDYTYVKSKFNHPSNVVKYLGLCRYDLLLEFETDKTILIMPTWRSWLHNCKSKQEFKNTGYFKKYNDLLNSDIFNEILQKYGYKAIFYPHYEVQKFINCFEISSNNIQIASQNSFDIQTLLKSSKLLITDNSSVYFDFAYMKKPIIFYTFDIEELYTAHYNKGYIDIRNHPFGESCNDVESICSSIIDSISNEFKINSSIEKEINKFFIIRDEKNCERNYREICNLL